MSVDWGTFVYGAANSDRTATVKDPTTNAAVDLSSCTAFTLRARALDGSHSFDLIGSLVTDGTDGQIAFDSIAAAGTKPKLGKSFRYEARVMWTNAESDVEVQPVDYRFSVENFDGIGGASTSLVSLTSVMDAIYRRRGRALFTGAAWTNGLVSTGSTLNIRPPNLDLAIGGGANRAAALFEYHHDPWPDPAGDGGAWGHGEHYHRVYLSMFQGVNGTLSAKTQVGMCLQAASPNDASTVSGLWGIELRWNFLNTRWEVSINDSTAETIYVPTVQPTLPETPVFKLLEIHYVPSVGIDFKISGQTIYTVNDSTTLDSLLSYNGGDYGNGWFLRAGNGGAVTAQAWFTHAYCEDPLADAAL